VEGRFFTGYDPSVMQFVPNHELLAKYPLDFSGSSSAVRRTPWAMVASAASGGNVDDLESAMGTLALRVREGRDLAAAQLTEELIAKRKELAQKLEALKELQARLASSAASTA